MKHWLKGRKKRKKTLYRQNKIVCRSSLALGCLQLQLKLVSHLPLFFKHLYLDIWGSKNLAKQIQVSHYSLFLINRKYSASDSQHIENCAQRQPLFAALPSFSSQTCKSHRGLPKLTEFQLMRSNP